MKKDVIVASESDVIVYLDGVNPKTQPATVRENGNYSNITLMDTDFDSCSYRYPCYSDSNRNL